MMHKLFWAFLLNALYANAQISSGEKILMPGNWPSESFADPPVTSQLRSNVVIAGNCFAPGTIDLYNSLYPPNALNNNNYQANFSAAQVGVISGTDNVSFIFSSGPCTGVYCGSNPLYKNKWTDGNFTLNTFTNCTYHTDCAGADNTVTLTAGKYYTMNFEDKGYANNRALFMETSNPPVSILSATANGYICGINGCAFTVQVNLSAVKSPEELVYVRYCIGNNFTGGATGLAKVNFCSGSASGIACIPNSSPSINNGDKVWWYVLTTTITTLSGGTSGADADLATMRSYTNSNTNFMTSVNTATQYLSPLSGTYTIGAATDTWPGGCNFSSLAAAIGALDCNGVNGNVIINISAGYAETAPPGGYLLLYTCASVNYSSSTQTITIQKSGIGANPILTAQTGAGSSDGIFKIVGADYVTINGIDLLESATNTTAASQMEAGYALLQHTSTDGTQNCQIENCTITLNANASSNNPCAGIMVDHVLYTNFSGGTTIDASTTTNACNNNTFYVNTLKNCFNDFAFNKQSSSLPNPDQNNDVGGAALSTGNQVQAFGSSTIGTPCTGIYAQYENNLNIQHNSLNNTAGGGTASSTTINGIQYLSGAINLSATISNNIIQLNNGGTGSSINPVSISASGNGTVNVQNNTIQNCQFSNSATSVGNFTGIGATSPPNTLNITGNTFLNNALKCAGTISFINFSGSQSGTATFLLANNTASTGNSRTATTVNVNSNEYFIYINANLGNGTMNISNNTFSNWSRSSGGAPTVNASFLYCNPPNPTSFNCSLFIHTNTFNAGSFGNFTGNIYGIFINSATYASHTVANNTISSITSTGNSIIYGIDVAASSFTINNNSLTNLSSTGSSGTVTGIYSNSISNSNIYQNTVSDLSCAGSATACTGALLSASGTINFYKNNITTLSQTSASGLVNGVTVTAGTINIYNNILQKLSAPNNPAGYSPVSGISAGVATVSAHYNTINIGGQSGATGFGATGITYSLAGSLTCDNNIVYLNITTPAGANSSCMRRVSGAAGTAPPASNLSSNNNVYYIPSGTNNFIYCEGTTSPVNTFSPTSDPDFNNTCSLYKTFMQGNGGSALHREILSFYDKTPFTYSGADPLNLQLSTSTESWASNGATPIGSPAITDDYSGTVRDNVQPDVGAFEYNCIYPDLKPPAASANCSAAPVALKECFIEDLPWIDFYEGNKKYKILSLKNNSNLIGTLNLSSYNEDLSHVPANTDFPSFPDNYLNKIWQATVSTQPTQNTTQLRFYFTKTESDALFTSAGCGACTALQDILLTQYSGLNENGCAGDDANTIASRNFYWAKALYTNLSPSFPNGIFNLYIGPPSGNVIQSANLPTAGYYFEAHNVPSFSEFRLHSQTSFVLPVTLVYFRAEKSIDKKVLCTWETATELNCNHFDVQVAVASSLNKDFRFVTIGTIKGNENSSFSHNYSFVDNTVTKSGTRYYRLEEVDDDGQTHDSEIIPLQFGTNESITVYPNPVNAQLNINLTSPLSYTLQITISDQYGNSLSSTEKSILAGVNTFSIPVNRLLPGFYLIEMKSENGLIDFHSKFEKL